MLSSHILVLLISIAAGILLSGLLYFKTSQFSKSLKPVLFALRATSFALILYIILAPLFHIKKAERLNPIVAVLVDNSSSMVMHADSANIKANLISKLGKVVADIDQAEFQFFRFDDELSTNDADFTGAATNMGQALNHVKNRVDEQRLSAIVLASDGIANLGVNPLYESERSFLPIYTIGVGDSAKQIDLSVAQVGAPEFVFLGDELVAEVTVLVKNKNGLATEVLLKHNGAVLKQKSITASSNDFAGQLNFTIKPSKPGVFRYDVHIPAQPGEINTTNNTYSFYVEVIENRKKITILTSAPDPDVAALRESLSAVDAYDVAVQNDLNSALRTGTELVIACFGPNTVSRNMNKLLQNYTGPLWLMVSPQASTQQVNRFMPWLNRQAGGQVAQRRPQVNKDFGLFNLSAEAKAFLGLDFKLGMHSGAGNEAGSFDNLLLDNQNRGLVRYGQVENQRVVLFTFSGLWQMRMQDFISNGSHKNVDEWLQLSAQYLTASGSGNRLKLRYEKRISSNQEQAVTIEVYDAAYKQSTEADVRLTLTNSAGKRFNFKPVQQGTLYITNVGVMQPGEYTIKAEAKLGSETLSGNGAFIAIEEALEAKTTQANFTLLQQLATSTGGTFHEFSTVNALAADLEQAPVLTPVERITSQTIELIDVLWLLVVAIILLTTEWVLRRYFGTV